MFQCLYNPASVKVDVSLRIDNGSDKGRLHRLDGVRDAELVGTVGCRSVDGSRDAFGLVAGRAHLLLRREERCDELR
ncbi:hypothetical protein [Streptomyces sp. NPDC002602]|uniref:hypothetical protein n=1 Tax=Streptomyces sp. NPDC002602 TaxID=3364654 RepID=UPI003688F08E